MSTFDGVLLLLPHQLPDASTLVKARTETGLCVTSTLGIQICRELQDIEDLSRELHRGSRLRCRRIKRLKEVLLLVWPKASFCRRVWFYLACKLFSCYICSDFHLDTVPITFGNDLLTYFFHFVATWFVLTGYNLGIGSGSFGSDPDRLKVQRSQLFLVFPFLLKINVRFYLFCFYRNRDNGDHHTEEEERAGGLHPALQYSLQEKIDKKIWYRNWGVCCLFHLRIRLKYIFYNAPVWQCCGKIY